MDLSLIIPAFIAGLLTFLAPCTLPLVPGFLGFISGVSLEDLKKPSVKKSVRKKIFFNALLYVIGFTIVFMLMGSVFSLGGIALSGYRIWFSRIGGVFVIVFGLYMMHVFDMPFLNFLNTEKRVQATKHLRPGQPLSSFVFGAAFAFGWTPCVGPILGSILLLASSGTTVVQGAFLLLVFSSGLALPFLALALLIGHASEYIKKVSRYMKIISIIGGIFLVFLGILLITNTMQLWLSFAYKAFSFINYDSLLDHL